MAKVEHKPKTITKERPQKIVENIEDEYSDVPLKAGFLPEAAIAQLKKYPS